MISKAVTSAALFLVGVYLLTTTSLAAGDVAQATIDKDGTIHVPAISVPLSSLESDEAKRYFLDFVHLPDVVHDCPTSPGAEDKGNDINVLRKKLDDCLMRPGVEKLRAVFPVTIKPKVIGGVQTDVIDPAGGIAGRNTGRVLINLHGGGFTVAAGLGGQMESIPIASLGKIKVITVDYREGPEHQFPAASEDVATVYRALLKQYRPENIGIYGCSAGGILTAESVAWFQSQGLPMPGAIALFGAGAIVDRWGDAMYFGAMLEGGQVLPFDTPEMITKAMPYFNGTNLSDPLVSPASSPSVLRHFPPTLLISGTRDHGLSTAAYTQAQLVNVGVEADLHVWEGAPHCSFAQPMVDPNVPETRQAWDVTVAFFEKHLGRGRH